MSAVFRRARRTFDRTFGGAPRVVRVLSGPARGARLALDLGSEKSYWLGRYEREVQLLLREMIRAGDVVYDVGANIGFFSVLAARLGGEVFAFELLEDNAARVRVNATLNAGRIQVTRAAVWDGGDGVAAVPGDSPSEWHAEPGRGVPSVTLDAFAREHRPPDIVKIDVEGAEERVLRGGREALQHARLVVCEAHGDAAAAAVRAELAGMHVTTLGGPWRIVALRQA